VPEIRSFYELLGFSSLIACYLVRLGDQISFSGLSKFFLRGGAKTAPHPLKKWRIRLCLPAVFMTLSTA